MSTLGILAAAGGVPLLAEAAAAAVGGGAEGSAWSKMVHTWTTGGWVMLALATLAVLMYSTAARLLISLHYRGIQGATDRDIRGWLAEPSRAPERIRELIRYTQDEVRSLRDIEGRFREVEAAAVPEADRQLNTLGVMVVAAPLFGLLGTVLGMLLTFRAIGVGGSSVSEIVARGISEALVATQSGLMVALPGWMAAYVAKRWKVEFVAFLARLESIALRFHRDRLPGLTAVPAASSISANPAAPAGAAATPSVREELVNP